MKPRPIHLVTGANTGIGLEIARGLAGSGAHVVLACRDARKGDAARASIDATVREASTELLVVDLASQASIRRAAAAFSKAHAALDVLVNNAAVISDSRQVTDEGIELVFATNVLGYHLLTALMRPLLEQATSGRGRVVNVASAMAYGLDVSDVEWKRRSYDVSAAYAQSKQANRMLTWALARRLAKAGSRVTANAMHPGPVDTPLLHALLPGMKGRTTAKGAETAVWLATSADVEGTTGRFWGDLREMPCSFRDEAREDALWSLCDRMCGLS
jgi:NAD(P)-dependent dehydrogenase (short-subunit alcohol dehydrogenase family)